MVALLFFFLALFASPFKSKSRLEAENAALRHQLAVLRRKVRGRVQLTIGDRLFLIQLYRWFPLILKAITIVRPDTQPRAVAQDWLSRQMTEAFPWDTAPRYLLRDRDKSYGPAFRHRVRAMGITEVITAPRSPWQNPYAERLIGSIRQECLDHVIIFSERHLRRVLSSYFQYHHDTRTHLSLGKDCPRPRPIQSPSAGNIIAIPEVGGLHHRYERRAA